MNQPLGFGSFLLCSGSFGDIWVWFFFSSPFFINTLYDFLHERILWWIDPWVLVVSLCVRGLFAISGVWVFVIFFGIFSEARSMIFCMEFLWWIDPWAWVVLFLSSGFFFRDIRCLDFWVFLRDSFHKHALWFSALENLVMNRPLGFSGFPLCSGFLRYLGFGLLLSSSRFFHNHALWLSAWENFMMNRPLGFSGFVVVFWVFPRYPVLGFLSFSSRLFLINTHNDSCMEKLCDESTLGF